MYQPKSVTNWCNQWWVLGVSIGFLLVHLFPFLYFKQWPVLGFDTGFYRRYLIEPFTSLPHAAVPGLDHTVILPRVFLDLIRLTGLPIDVVLYGGYVLASALLFGGIFFFVREQFGSKAAYVAVFLILFSPVYYHGYWFFLLKNVLALALFFWLLYALKRENLALAFFLTFLIPITHQSTTIFVGLFFFVAGVHAYVTKHKWRVLFGLWGITFIMYLIYHPTVAAKLAAPPTAIFLTTPEFLLMATPLLLGFLVLIRRNIGVLKKEWVLGLPLAIVLIFTLFSLPYAERFFYTGIFFLAILIAVTWQKVVIPRYLLFILFFSYLSFVFYFMLETHPLFGDEVVRELTSLEVVPQVASVVTPNYLASWVHGYTTATVYAPGVFKDAAPPASWEYYWSHQSPLYDRDFLGSYPSPLYLFVPPNEAVWFLPESDCIEQKSAYLYLYLCGD